MIRGQCCQIGPFADRKQPNLATLSSDQAREPQEEGGDSSSVLPGKALKIIWGSKRSKRSSNAHSYFSETMTKIKLIQTSTKSNVCLIQSLRGTTNDDAFAVITVKVELHQTQTVVLKNWAGIFKKSKWASSWVPSSKTTSDLSKPKLPDVLRLEIDVWVFRI